MPGCHGCHGLVTRLATPAVSCTPGGGVPLALRVLTRVLAVQGVVSTLLGFFLLGGVDFHAMNVLGIAINAVGGTW